MTVELPEHWVAFLRSQVQSGRYASEAAVLDEALRLLSERDPAAAPEPAAGRPDATARKPIWEVIAERAAAVPAGERDKVPADLAEQHDHYIYGTPKRSPP